jgi:CBS domain containing-hemolysin-like protein
VIADIPYFIALLLFSAFFSGMEAAYFSLDILKRARMARLSSASARRSIKLLQRPRDLLVTILIGNMLVNTTLSSKASDLFGESTALSIIVITFTILVFGEITPKSLGCRYNDRYAPGGSALLVFFSFLFAPLRVFLKLLMRTFLRKAGPVQARRTITEDEFMSAVKRGGMSGVLEQASSGILSNIVGFLMLEARHIMTPRTSIHALPIASKMSSVMEFARKTSYSKIPLYRTNKDDIVGYFHTKDLLPYMTGAKKPTSMKRLLRPVFRIPEGKLLADFLPEMQQNTSRLAVVVDEYGGTAGIITLDDVLEEIMGQLLDENESAERMFWAKTKRTSVFRGTTPLAFFNQRMGTNITSEDYQTLSGYLLELAGRIPAENDTFDAENFRYRVLLMNGNHISQIEVTRK